MLVYWQGCEKDARDGGNTPAAMCPTSLLNREHVALLPDGEARELDKVSLFDDHRVGGMLKTNVLDWFQADFLR